MNNTSRINNLERRARALTVARNPVQSVTLTLVDGTRTEPMLWVDAAQIVLDGGAVSVKCDDANIQGLLRAMLAGETETN